MHITCVILERALCGEFGTGMEISGCPAKESETGTRIIHLRFGGLCKEQYGNEEKKGAALHP